MRRYGLRDDQWERIAHLQPGREGHLGITAADNRLFIEAVLYRYRAGIPWRDLPERFSDLEERPPPSQPIVQIRRWENVFKYLASDADNEYAMIDSTNARAHQHSAGAEKSRAGPSHLTLSRRASTKIPTIVDALGNPPYLTGGQAHDLKGADHLLANRTANTLIADKHMTPTSG